MKTKDGFDGDITMLVFPLQNKVDVDIESLSQEIGSFLVAKVSWICDFNIIKGFLNLKIFDTFYVNFLKDMDKQLSYGHKSIDKEKNYSKTKALK